MIISFFSITGERERERRQGGRWMERDDTYSEMLHPYDEKLPTGPPNDTSKPFTHGIPLDGHQTLGFAPTH